MAGHSQFKNIMYRKGAQDAKRAKIFAKISREITVAVKMGGAAIESNARLKAALINARGENMPKDNIERAIKKASGADAGAEYAEVRYEGYGPGGVALIVEGLTDNKNRTAPEVRAAFNKFGGSLGESGSVSFQFERQGVLEYKNDLCGEEEFWEAVIDAGAKDLQSQNDMYVIVCDVDLLGQVRNSLSEKFGDPETSKIVWAPLNTISIDESTAGSLFKLIDILEDNDDIQSVTGNYEVSEEIMEKILS